MGLLFSLPNQQRDGVLPIAQLATDTSRERLATQQAQGLPSMNEISRICPGTPVEAGQTKGKEPQYNVHN